MDKTVADVLNRLISEGAGNVPADKAYVQAKKKSAPRKLWDNYREVAVVTKSDRLRFVIAACTREGYRCISIREFYHRKRDDAWVPGRDGITIPVAAPLGKTRKPDPNNPPKLIYPMREFLLALQQACEVVVEMELDDPDNAVWLAPKESTTNAQEEDNENR